VSDSRPHGSTRPINPPASILWLLIAPAPACQTQVAQNNTAGVFLSSLRRSGTPTSLSLCRRRDPAAGSAAHCKAASLGSPGLDCRPVVGGQMPIDDNRFGRVGILMVVRPTRAEQSAVAREQFERFCATRLALPVANRVSIERRPRPRRGSPPGDLVAHRASLGGDPPRARCLCAQGARESLPGPAAGARSPPLRGSCQ
jgi:hypothetical protein